MIRYVDSAGWTWEVCELADRNATSAPPAGPARPADRLARAPLAPPIVADRAAPEPDPLDAMGELYFFSRVGARKLRGDYPPTWTQLSRTDLEALCDRAQELGTTATM